MHERGMRGKVLDVNVNAESDDEEDEGGIGKSEREVDWRH